MYFVHRVIVIFAVIEMAIGNEMCGFRTSLVAHEITIPPVGAKLMFSLSSIRISHFRHTLLRASLSLLYFLFAAGEPAKSRSASLSYGRKRDDWIYSSHDSTTVQKSYTT